MGIWYFEASFPIRLVGENGEELGIAIAQAQDEWMTEALVPFEAVLSFESSEAQKGFLVFEKDNPSGLQENADEMRLPILIPDTQIE